MTGNSFVPVHNSPAIQVVRTQLNGHTVTGQNADEVLAHSSRDVCQYFVIRLELHLEHGVGQRLNYRCHDLNRIFLRQTVSTSERFRALAFWTELLLLGQNLCSSVGNRHRVLEMSTHASIIRHSRPAVA